MDGPRGHRGKSMTEVTREAALKDYRYIDGHDEEIEAYQMTEHTVFADGHWPPWLRMQRTKRETNVVFRQVDDPQSLYINMDGEEGQLGYNAWIIRGADDSLAVMGEFEFRAAYTKVVPVPDPPVMEATDGQTDQEFYDSLDPKVIEKLGLKNPRNKLKPDNSNIAEVIDQGVHEQLIDVQAVEPLGGGEILELRAAMLDAIVHLKALTSKGAIKATLRLEVGLETAHEGGLKWCECRPGSCDEVSKWGCRKSSPLL
jgi:hypothetical protein